MLIIIIIVINHDIEFLELFVFSMSVRQLTGVWKSRTGAVSVRKDDVDCAISAINDGWRQSGAANARRRKNDIDPG